MLYVVYNQDGSLKYTNLNEIITQGSTTTKLLVSVEGYNTSGYTAIAYCILPNGSSSAVEGELTTDEDTGITGFEFALTQDETYYYGELQMSVKLYIAGTDTILFTIPIHLTINKTGFVANSTNITITQYSNLIDRINESASEYYVDIGLAKKPSRINTNTGQGITQLTNDQIEALKVGDVVAEYPGFTGYIVNYKNYDTCKMYHANSGSIYEAIYTKSGDTWSFNRMEIGDFNDTRLYRHTLTIVGTFEDSADTSIVNMFLVNNDSTDINTASLLEEAVGNAVSIRGYFSISETIYRILDSYFDGEIVILFGRNEVIVAKEFYVSSVVDEKDKL